MKRHGHFAPEITSLDLESSSGAKPFAGAGGRVVGLDGGVPTVPHIQPFQALGGDGSKSKRSRGALDDDAAQKALVVAGGIWLLGVFAGYDWLWPLWVALDLLAGLLSIPPFSWLFGWVWGPISWVTSWFYRGAPLVSQVGALQELRLPADQVSVYVDSYMQQYGDAALIFASHDGYPQIVGGLLLKHEYGYHELIDAMDDNGNTALIYAASKGYRQTSGTLLHSGADPDVANQGGGGRTPLMEAAGGGHKDIVALLRSANATLDVADDFGNTALHYAAYHGHLSVVTELLRGNPRRDIQNSYGHTAASYAQTNKHKAIADLLNRAPTRKERERAELTDRGKKDAVGDLPDFDADLAALRELKARKHKEERHVKGGAEQLHKGDWNEFAPKTEKGPVSGSSLTDTERKSLEDEIARLKHAHDDAELKAQRRIVELLERSAGHQKELDEALRESRALRLNQTELQLKLADAEQLRRSSELRVAEEKERADRLHEEHVTATLELQRLRRKVEEAESERDLLAQAARRHEDAVKRKQEEVSDHLARHEQHRTEVGALREELRRREDELRSQVETVARLRKELIAGMSADAGAGSSRPSPSPTSAPSPPPAPPSPSLPEAQAEAKPDATSSPPAAAAAPDTEVMPEPSSRSAEAPPSLGGAVGGGDPPAPE